MRLRLPFLSVALLAAALYLLLREDAPRPSLDDAVTAPAPAPRDPDTLGGAQLTGSKPAGAAAAPAPKAPPPSIDPRTLPRGPLSVAVFGPDDRPIPSEDVRVQVGPGKGSREWHATPLLFTEPGSNVWRSTDVLAGAVEVRVTGDHIVTKSVQAKVVPGTPTDLKVYVDRAGAIAYAVTLFSGEAPEQVTLTLLDGQRKPVAAQFQVRTPSVLTTPRFSSTVTQGPQGVVLGIAPGRYTLRAVTADEEYDEVAVEIAAGATVEVSLSIRK